MDFLFTDIQIKSRIAFRMHKHGFWKARHTDPENLKKGWKMRMLGRKGLKRVEEMIKEMIKEELLLLKKTHHGPEVSLNPDKEKEIFDLIAKEFPEY